MASFSLLRFAGSARKFPTLMDTNAPQSAGLYDFLGWLETNKKRVAIGAGVAVVVALAIGLFVWQRGERVIKAEEALASVRMPYSPLEIPAAGTADALAKIAADYPGTPAAAKALLRAGTVYFGDGNYAKAREQFDAYLRNFGATAQVKDAVFGLAVCLDAENKSAEAITKYKDFITTYGADPVADMARFNLVRLYEQSNQPQLALEILTKMVGTPAPNQPPSQASQEAQAKIRAIYAKNPALMPAPVTAAPTVRPAVQQQPLVLKPQDAPSQPTPGQPNPVPTQPTPAQPAPAK
jgi:tetratricopeptide (TPR) repeat protein